ncbi:MAG: recombinase family protein [Myxococcaceae bacterium]
MKTCTIYARFSTDRQNESSLEDQERCCRTWARANDFKVERVYNDAAQSGATLARPALQQLLAAAPDSGWSAVLVNDQSRLSRDTEGTLALIRQLLKLDIVVIDCTSGTDISDPDEELKTVVNGWQLKQFRRMIGSRTTQRLTRRAEDGHWCGGRVYGFRTVPVRPEDEKSPKVPVVDQEEAAVVLRVFNACAKGDGLRTIADGLNRDQVPAPYDGKGLGYGKKAGRGWGHTTIRAILRNPRYRGRFTWNRLAWTKDWDTGKRVPRVRPEAEHKVTERPELAIVPQKLWDAVQERLGARQGVAFGVAKQFRAQDRIPSPLAGLLRCGTCGGPMSVAGRKNGYRTFACSTRRSKGKHGPCPNAHGMNEGALLDFVGETLRGSLKRKLGEDKAFESFVQHVARVKAVKKGPDVKALDADVRKAQARAKRVAETLLAVGVSDILREELRLAEAEVARSTAARAAADGAGVPAPSQALDPRVVRQMWEMLDCHVTERDPLKLGPFLKEHVEGVTITPRDKAQGGVVWTLALDVRLPASGSCGGGI